MALKADATAVKRLDAEKASTGEIENLNQRMHELQQQVRDYRLSLLDQERRLKVFLREAMTRMPKEIAPSQIENMMQERDHFLDAFYVSFEDRFRGTRSDIHRRLTVYLPYMQALQTGTETVSTLDLGCGRGEWLELLKTEGYPAMGIDCNHLMIAECSELGLDVAEEDLFAHLSGRRNAELDVVTAFHVVEHLSLGDQITMLDEALRVLRPKGMVILESPNPQNIMVGACNFYYDPTHRNPIPPPILKYMAEARGFCDVSILELHPVEPEARENLGDSELARVIANLFYGPRDYAIIGYKP